MLPPDLRRRRDASRPGPGECVRRWRRAPHIGILTTTTEDPGDLILMSTITSTGIGGPSISAFDLTARHLRGASPGMPVRLRVPTKGLHYSVE